MNCRIVTCRIMSKKVLFNRSIIILLLSLNGCFGSPKRLTLDRLDPKIVGQATNIIAAKILKGGIENNKNFVFSPFGFSTILTILSEGAGNDTNNDITKVLKHPDNRLTVRDAYKNVIEYFQGNNPHVVPQFRTWFYIYKNNSVDEAYKHVLENDYYVTVKEIDRDSFYDLNEGEMSSAAPETNESTVKSTAGESGTAEKTADASQVTKTLGESGKNNSKDVIDFDTLKAESEPVDETRIDAQKDASKFDEVVEDRQYVEVPEIKKKIQLERSDEVPPVEEKKENNLVDDKQTVSTEAPTTATKVDEPEKFTLPLKQFEEMEIMQAQESRLGKAFGGSNEADGTSIISGNSIVGEKENPVESDTDKYESKMMLFNGLYYRGNWATPFQHLRDEGIDNVFYTSEENKIPVKMMRSRGYYSVGDIAKMDSEVIEFPYDNERYSMLVIMPKSRDGLRRLIADLTSNCLHEITAKLSYELIDVSLPKFQVETTSGAEKTLAKEGLASLFTSKADFSGISKEQKLRVSEIQQHVSFRVDEGSSSENILTAANSLRSNAQVERTIVVDRPFLFFVRDRIDDVVIVAGKIISLPGYENDEPEIPK